MATRKKTTKAAANDAPQMTPDELNSVTKLVTHTARMNQAIEQSPSKQTHKQRGYDVIISGYKTRWAGLSKDQKSAAVEAAHDYELDSKTIKAAVAALED